MSTDIHPRCIRCSSQFLYFIMCQAFFLSYWNEGGVCFFVFQVLCIITAPVSLIINKQHNAKFAFVALSIMFCCFLSMGVIFVPKVSENKIELSAARNSQGKVLELKRYPNWNRGVLMASRRGQIPLAVFYSTHVLPIRLATVSTQGLCLIHYWRRHYIFWLLW